MALTGMLQGAGVVPAGVRALDDLKLVALALLVGGAGVVLIRRRRFGRLSG